MKNLDTKLQNKQDILQRINAALKSGNEEEFGIAFNDYTDLLQAAVMDEAKGLIAAVDNRVLEGRGARQLTAAEENFYNAFAKAAGSNNPQQAFTGTDVILPKTIIDAVFEDLTDAHPLLAAINFRDTAWLTEILVSTTGGVGVWGDVTGAILGELSAGFAKIDLEKSKFTAFVIVAKGMIDLGPIWMDRYIRAMLGEALATGLEGAIVDGDGNKKPIGMTRALTGAVDGVYPRKTATAITDLGQATYGDIMDKLSQGPNNKRRAISGIAMVVNPADYYTKVMPAITVRTMDGGFNHNVFPFPTTVFQSAAVPVGNAVFGLLDKYFAGLGSAKEGKIVYDDSVKFFEDQRAYAIKFYGDGRAMDENAFVLTDITGLEVYTPKVILVDESAQP